MHRSGTSLLTSVLHAAGVAVGERLLAPDANNPRGYFEDADFYELHLRMLHACTRQDDPGFRDWGWTESEWFDRGRLPDFRAAARALIAKRRGSPGPWGWKDPRTALLLDFWHDVLVEAGTSPGYLLVYRPPWDVADAMQRISVDTFREHPEYAFRIWTFYNRPLLDFHRRHREQSLLVPIGAVLADPGTLAALLAAKLDLQVDAGLPARLYAAGGLVTRAADDPLVGLVAATSPAAVGLLDELDLHADLPDTARRRRPRPPRQPPTTGPDAAAVSVVVACRDQGDLLVEAMASAERHAPDGELIVVDDGSRQARTVQVLDGLRRAGYQVIQGAGGGLAAARNAGFARARGRYVLPLDAGDRLQGGFLEPARELLDSQAGVGAVYAGRREVWHGARTVEVAEFDLDRLLRGNFIASCALVRKTAWEACGGYDELLPSAADWDLWIGLAERGWQLRKVPGVACDHRVPPLPAVDPRERGPLADRLPEPMVRKHQALYLLRLPDLLSASQLGGEAAGEGSPPAAPAAPAAERDRLDRELQAWRDRVRFMESTRAWRVRERLLHLRQLLRGGPWMERLRHCFGRRPANRAAARRRRQ
jgi:hypothetical protein